MIKKLCCISLLFCMIFTLAPAASASQAGTIFINEVCTKNNGTNGNEDTQVLKSGEYCDYIELYNNSDRDIDISGYGITDDSSDLFKGTIPSGSSIPAKGYFIIYCAKSDEMYAAFGLSADGEYVRLTSPEGVMIDEVQVPAISADTCYARSEDGGASFAILAPTPQKSNTLSDTFLPSSPEFSKATGIYTEGFSLNLSTATSGAIIYYTIDGSDPESSETRVQYSKPIPIYDRSGEANVMSAVDPSLISVNSAHCALPDDDEVDKGTVVRAVAYKDGKYSKVSTASYLIGSWTSKLSNISVMSVSVDYNDFYDYETGIYVTGKVWDEFKANHPGVTSSWLIQANHNQRGKEWERDCHIDYIDDDGTVFSSDCGVRTQGAGGRDNLQKSLRFYARTEYNGSNRFNYAFFDSVYDEKGKVVDEYKTIVMRAGGNDASSLKYTDSYLQSLVADRDFETQTGKACIMFINGEYWGIYTLQEDYTAQYFEEKYGVDSDDVVIIKRNEIEEGTEDDMQLFYDTYEFITNNRMKDAENYEKACEMMDMQSFIDYMSVEMYICNNDWPDNNIALWRTRSVDKNSEYGDGRWRFMLYDTEYSTGEYNSGTCAYYYDSLSAIIKLEKDDGYYSHMLFSLLKNADFKRQFINSFLDITYINFRQRNWESKLSQYQNAYSTHFSDHYARFNNGSVNSATSRYSQVYGFLKRRQSYAAGFLGDACNIRGSLEKIKINIKNSTGGSLILNGKEIDLTPFSNDTYIGYYYINYPISLEAVADEGYYLADWEGYDAEGEIIDVTPVEDKTITVTAVFEKYEKGDVNGDGNINGKDVLALRKYIVGLDSDIIEKAALINNDDSINGKDVLQLRKYIIGIVKEL